IMDAMAARLPVVATRVGGIPEVVEDGETGILIPPRDPETLARTILRLANDRELAGRLGAQGFESVQRKFSAEAMVSRIVDLYEKIAAPKKINLRA
ncbi:MAG TPA: glycosyltransferase family 4 protein, partial [Candidatus Aminicenantes bacterium]|nr:glycosyltransferase family 4 protein [Candidatus Aminicenantes bacterium]